MRHAPPDSLHDLLDEWQPQPRVAAGFEQRLQRRIREVATEPMRRPWLGWSWAAGAVAAVLLATLGTWQYAEHVAPAPSAAPVQVVQLAAGAPRPEAMDALTRDLQALNQDGELLENLDFLAAPHPAAVTRESKD